LDFLEDQGLAHRIRRLNAFTACMHPGESHSAAFLICRACSTVSESAAAPILTALQSQAGGFLVETSTIEALGLCPACQTT
jgi:Fur family zinc uptake transcriptional regulator